VGYNEKMGSKICRKCGEVFPTWITIDGKERNLGNRRFCLVCSPFGSRNTKRDDPARQTVYGTPYRTWPEEKRAAHRAYVLKRGNDLKLELIKEFGGGCQHCGYNRCARALHFHHRDRKTKSFGMIARNLRLKSAEAVSKEAKKCDLVCVRCHAEIEAGLVPNKNT
jgi:hypothetical protein